MTEIEKIDSELAHERQVKTRLEQELATTVKLQTENDGARQSVAYGALAEGDAKSLAKLSEIDDSTIKLTPKILSIKAALSVCENKIEKFQIQRVEAVQAGKRREYEAAQEALLKMGAEIETALKSFLEQKVAIKTHLRSMSRLALEAGIEAAAHRNVEKALNRALTYPLETNNYVFNSEVKKLYGKVAIQEIFERTMNGVELAEDNSDEKTGTN